MRITEAEIRNFQGIEHCSLLFEPGFNLIRGTNGSGKTAVLEALATGLGGFVCGIPEVPARGFTDDDVRRTWGQAEDGLYTPEYHLPVQVKLTAVMDSTQKSYTWIRTRSGLAASRSSLQPRDIAWDAETMANQPSEMLPLLCYESATRTFSRKSGRTGDGLPKRYLRTTGYLDALSGASPANLLLGWCVRMEQVAWQKGQKISEYEAAKKAVQDFMAAVDQQRQYELFFDKQLMELMVLISGRALPVSALSAGLQSLIRMVFDIAFRMALLNPHLLDRITETPGIVLIDDLDQHLHPAWQPGVIRAMRRVFPHVQLIAAAHAQVLSAPAEDVHLIDLQDPAPGTPETSISH
ncbi:MAG: AAA family ATPase [Clostridia bacterium]|nr:AAA family ATPase [Clostridia bacterium]